MLYIKYNIHNIYQIQYTKLFNDIIIYTEMAKILYAITTPSVYEKKMSSLYRCYVIVTNI